MIYFLDTSVMLKNFTRYTTSSQFVISSRTIQELECIAYDRNVTENHRIAARYSIEWLCNHRNCYEVFIDCDDVDQVISKFGLNICDADNRICSSAYLYLNNYDKTSVFVTCNLNRYSISKQLMNIGTEWFKDNKSDIYKGYKEIIMSDNEMAYFYEHQTDNKYDLITNQYLIIKDSGNKVIDVCRWNGDIFQMVKISNINSNIFGQLKPYNGDVYQQCLLNSFINNKITMVRGSAGTGKTYCAIGYLLFMLEKHKIDKIVLLTNTMPTINTARLGFYPGSRDQKLLESSIGNILSSKLGDSFIVERLISEGKLVLLPMCDIRGYDTSNMNAGVLITEAQNLNIELMKLALQRIGEDSICIIDGDNCAQVDSNVYSGESNGMKRLSEVFRGHSFYGEIELKNIYRSRIAELADRM